MEHGANLAGRRHEQQLDQWHHQLPLSAYGSSGHTVIGDRQDRQPHMERSVRGVWGDDAHDPGDGDESEVPGAVLGSGDK